jgi:hypothetical protein
MKTKIFAYKGVVGAESDLKNGKFMNDPYSPGQLGLVINANEVEISKEAKDLIRKAPREGGSFAPIMLSEHGNGTTSIGLMGFWKHIFSGEDLCISRDCDLSALDKCKTVENNPPKEFVNLIDKNIKQSLS